MRSTIRYAVVAALAGAAIGLTTTGTATAGDEPWPRGSGIAPAGADGYRDTAGWSPDYPLNENVAALGNELWPKGSG